MTATNRLAARKPLRNTKTCWLTLIKENNSKHLSSLMLCNHSGFSPEVIMFITV